jgi:hypothetical protein
MCDCKAWPSALARWNELLGGGIPETSIIAYKSFSKNKWYQSPLHLFHILVVAVQFLPEHFFFT